MLSFGLVTEGPTDQVVIENILYGVFKNPDLPITRLQPAPDEPGNWVKVFDYCCSEEFRAALGFNDYLIVQVDTDVLISEQLPEKYRVDLPSDLSVEEIVKKVSDMLISLIDGDDGFWEEFKEQIIFGISVHQLECWILPIYFTNKPKTAQKITGCIDALNRVIKQKEGFYIDAKDLRYYSKMSKHFKKKIHKIHHLNPSLKIFVERILEIEKNNEEEE